MIRSLLALAALAALSSTARAEDFHEGYVCEVRLVALDTLATPPNAAGVGRLSFFLRANADCTGDASVLWVCSVDAPTGGDCATGKKFTRAEMQGIYGALTNAVGTGLRAAAYTAADRTAITVLHIKR